MTRLRILLAILAAAALVAAASFAATSEQRLAGEILKATGVKGGIIVHVGCGDGRLTAALRANDRYLVEGLESDPQQVAAAREYVRARGLSGKVNIVRWTGDRLPYIDNCVNLIVAENLGRVSKAEVMRALAPGGVAYIKSTTRWAKVVKPRPEGMDEWTHYLHDATNNAVAHDSLIAPPRRYQWQAGPRYGRQHDHMSSVNAAVTANGRLFTIIDEAPRNSILIPPKWRLTARDAFNGTLLWERSIDKWHTHLWRLKSGPQLMTRRLVAAGDQVYVTLGIDAPLSALDAATGEVIRTYPETKVTEEILFSNGALILSVAGKGQPLRSDPNRKYRTSAEINADTRNPLWTLAPRTVMAVDPDSGRALWSKTSPVVSMSLAADGQHVLFHDGERIQCLDQKTGNVRWRSEPLPTKDTMRSSGGATLVIYKDVVLYDGQAPDTEQKDNRYTQMFAVSLKDGKTLWKAPHPPCGHMGTPEDILVAGGLVWVGEVAHGSDSGTMIGRDPVTGAVRSQFEPDVQTHWFHHRCYRAKATDKYLLFSRTGIEFIDYANKHWIPHHWVRGACLYGVLPANGLIYAPQHPCACYIEAKLYGFNAIAPPSPSMAVRREVPESERLLRGPAYDANVSAAGASPGDWPTFRHDASRSGATKVAVAPTGLRQTWRRKLGGKLSAPVAAEGKLFVASIDAGTVIALDANSGEPAWSFTAGSRVDSPPTIWQGRVLFGSADGCVYCLRAADGALMWRYRAAPEERRMQAFGEVESVWPVSGSVLIQDGVLYCVAGRSMFLDGGLRLLRLDPKTGRKLSETIMDDRDPDTGENLQSYISGLNMPVALPDVLSSDGRYVYMRSLPLTLDGKRKYVDYIPVNEQQGDDDHLFCPTGFLDDSMWHRSYWGYGRAWASGAGGYYRAGRVIPAGRPLVFDDKNVYGYGRLWKYYRWTTPLEYMLFAADKQAEVVKAGIERKPVKKGRKRVGTREIAVTRFLPSWSGDTSVQVNSMVLAGDAIVAAGPPDLVDEEQAVKDLTDPAVLKALAEQGVAYEGRRGGLLLVASRADGRRLAGYKLDFMPRFDGLIAANGRLYMTTVSGEVVCCGSQGARALTPAPQVTVTPRPVEEPPQSASAKPAVVKIDLPSAAGEFTRVSGGQVYRSKLGYLLHGTSASSLCFALKKLPAPLTGKATFSVKLNMAPAGLPKMGRADGFLVLAPRTVPASFIQCGVFLRQKKASILEGAGNKAHRADTQGPPSPEAELKVDLDLKAGEVKLSVGGHQTTLKLKKAPDHILYVGYAVQKAATDFSEIEMTKK